MGVKLKFSLVLFLTLCFAGFKSSAQDEQPSQEEFNQQHPELNLNDDKALLIEADAKTSKVQQNPTGTNTPAATPVKGKPDANKPSGEKTEDPLSFNFLYFIIQKFKISDIVDD